MVIISGSLKVRKLVILSVIITLFSTDYIYSQEKNTNTESDNLLQARVIKISRMSQPWKNQNVDLLLIDGMVHSGKFLAIREGAFQLNSNGRMKAVPFGNVETLVLKRKKQDLLLVGLAAVGMGGLIAAGVSLGFEPEGSEVAIAAATGSIIGFTIGWKNFYRDVSISIK